MLAIVQKMRLSPTGNVVLGVASTRATALGGRAVIDDSGGLVLVE